MFAQTGEAISSFESPDYDYFSFTLQGSTTNIPFTKGNIVELFSFENKAICTGGEMYLIGDEAIADPNIANTNFDAQISVAGWGSPDAPICSAGTPVNICPAPVACVVALSLAENNGFFTASMTPDTTWIGVLSTVNSAQITFRIPSKGYEIDNFQNLITGVIFDVTSRQNSPLIEQDYDYISISLNSFGTTDIPLQKVSK